MCVTQKAIAVLDQAETSLRGLVAEAASIGDYEAVSIITTWARGVGELTRPATAAANVESLVEPANTQSFARNRSGNSGASRIRGSKYPQFFRTAESLIKVAWSKTSGAEYEHKSPRTVLEKLATAIKTAGKKSELISMDQVLPLTADGEEIPSYQSYLCLAWLRNAQLLRQHGRQGYSIPPGIDLEVALRRKWASLPKRG